ncbi:methyltransferase domain-containing protein [Streptomyces sp. NPDC056488]|uniref:methyltransferase domain-containing protein n=1 Tax=unclassified Streptomyces TaxID=2593676 RepID=UPI0036CAE8DD
MLTTTAAAHPGAGGTRYGRTPHHPDDRIVHAVAEALGPARSVFSSDAFPDHDGHRLPFEDQAFDAATMLCSAPHQRDISSRLRELRRVTRGPVVLLATDPSRIQQFWLNRYAPDVLAVEARRHPTVAQLAAALGGITTIQPVPIPLDCTDTFDEAYYGRPELLLDPAARRAGPAWSFVDDRVREEFDTKLRQELRSGDWEARFGHLRRQPTYTGSLVILRATP